MMALALCAAVLAIAGICWAVSRAVRRLQGALNARAAYISAIELRRSRPPAFSSRRFE